MALSLNDLQFVVGQFGSYHASDQDNAGSGVTYFGFVNNHQEWYLLKQTVSGTSITWRYVKGIGAYATAWTNRVTQTYEYYYEQFR